MDTSASRSLSGSLGVGSIVFMVVAAAAPLTVVAGAVPLGIALGNGAGFPATFVLCCAVLLLFAVGFCAMSRHLPASGAFYSYVWRGLGRAPGLGTAFLALVTYTAVQVAVYAYLGVALGGLVEHYGGPSLPWWSWTIVALVVVAVLGYRHIELSSRVLGVLLLCEVGIVLVFDAVVVARGGGETGLSTAFLLPNEVGSGALGIAIMFAIASFIGFEATAIFRDEARDPARTIPRATYAALLLIAVFYALSSWAVISAWGDTAAVRQAGADPGGLLLNSIGGYLGTAGADVAEVLLVTSLFAAVLAFHNVIARYVFSLGNAGALPSFCGRSHPRHGSPHLASLAQTTSALALVVLFAATGLDPVAQVFAWMSGTATLGVLALMTLTCLAVVAFFRKSDVDRRVWHTLVAPLLGLAGLLTCLALTVANFSTLIGGSPGLAAVIGAILAGSFVLGIALSTVLRPSAAAAPGPAVTEAA
ncbi:APC family permease [Prauserella muralis]|uniref:Amino acid transporter n=1 Tax=Prauserella muralis TaxID=588067 RepID=A0A2V4AKG6_9PSEU|nr:APC family permease [Prauserella muralis]PXY20788.1 amino acid transporter [Prauserella muralis]TWE29811.1 amino acid/polyamine/organocation transporter (APC superfamily) [Prauserella muralis]